ncbi:MAG: hypothetical protein PVI80_07540 [Anaerolineae bacterium]
MVVELPPLTTDWLMFVLVNLVVPAIVWVTVVAGLILIVRDKVEEDDLVEFLSKQQANHREACCDLEGKEAQVGF